MNTQIFIPLLAITIHILLITKVVWTRSTVARPFLLAYLVSSAVWAVCSFAALSNFFPEHSSLLGKSLPLAGLWAVVAYCQLVCVFLRRRTVTWAVSGYGLLGILIVLTALGHVPVGSLYAGGTGAGALLEPRIYALLAGGALFSLLPLAYLLRAYRGSMDPEGRNQVLYLMVGGSFALVLSTRFLIPGLGGYPLEQVGHVGGALLSTYALTAPRLTDLKRAARRSLEYLSTSLLIAPFYLLALWGLYSFSDGWASPASIATIVGMVFILPWLVGALRGPVRRAIEGALYGKRLKSRESVLRFAESATAVLNLNDLADGMLKPLPKAVDVSHASLLVGNNGHYTSNFSSHIIGRYPVVPIKLSKDSPVAGWLARSSRPLLWPLMDAAPEFWGLSEVERNTFEATEIGLLMPVHAGTRLVAILALSRKRSGGPFSKDDVALLKELSSRTGIAISNAQLYTEAKEKAHTDELTGLPSHGYFHRRVDEEISRCARFGSVFSVLFLDLDLFKSYNDAFGHLAGDGILRQVAQHIKAQCRAADVAFRYGGDEFAIILPESSLDDARQVAERVRRKIETEMDCQGIALTCSIGIAAWPTDGVTREAVLQSADRALYRSKQAGRNVISVASEVDHSWEFLDDASAETEVLSTVHALAATVDAKDPNTYGHSKKTSDYAVRIAEVLGLGQDRVATIRAAALLHDIGKIRVCDQILSKPGPLTGEEWLSIREHPKFGVAILKHVKGLSGCLPVIQHHHERFDGSGYPAGLASDEIPVDARILAVADAYDAMTSPRPYRRSRLAHQEAIDELARCAGTHFDPKIVEVFAALWEPLDSYIVGGGISRVLRKLGMADPNSEPKGLPVMVRARRR